MDCPFTVNVVVTAAGKSTRIGGSLKKEFYPLKNGTVLSESVGVFFAAAEQSVADVPFLINKVVVTTAGDQEAAARSALVSLAAEQVSHIIFAPGGLTRQVSVLNGLRLASLYPADIYLIHDGARPFVSPQLICSVVRNTVEYGACVPGTPVVDTQAFVNSDGFITSHIDRSSVRALQTPQGFKGQKILDVAEQAVIDGNAYTDDTSIWCAYGGEVYVCPGDTANTKITYQSDLMVFGARSEVVE